MPLTPDTAHAFAERWYNAWNTSNVDAIMACYDEAIVHSSPFIARFNGTTDDSLHGIDAVRAYFTRALTQNPTPPGLTRFNPMHVAVGHDSVILIYRRMTGELAAEIFHLNQEHKITRSISHYGTTA
jgi:hypothetical protein